MIPNETFLRSHSAAFALFLTVAEQLNRQFLLAPVLYGSLGLHVALHVQQVANDVDILVPSIFLTHRWRELVKLMQQLQFVLTDVNEHEFHRGTDAVAFGEEESLLPFAGIDSATLAMATLNTITFKYLTPTDYLAVYQASQRDGYRQETRGKRDVEKVKLIEQFLEQLPHNRANGK